MYILVWTRAYTCMEVAKWISSSSGSDRTVDLNQSLINKFCQEIGHQTGSWPRKEVGGSSQVEWILSQGGLRWIMSGNVDPVSGRDKVESVT